MRLEIGMVAIIAAVLLFYLRLILIQHGAAPNGCRRVQEKNRAKKKAVKGRAREAEVYASLSS